MKLTGSVIPSSRFLANKIAQQIPKESRTIVELGAGDGVITRYLLKHMPEQAHLTSYEISKQLLPHLAKIDHPRFLVSNHSALELDNDFAQSTVDVVISSLPIALFDQAMKQQLLSQIRKVLTTNGLFIQYQYLPKDKKLILQYFPDTKTLWSALNVPPAFIYISRNSAK